MLDQVQLVRSVLEVLKAIKDTRGDFDPCGDLAGRKFMDRIKSPGQEILIDNTDPENPEVTILPPTFRINNSVVS